MVVHCRRPSSAGGGERPDNKAPGRSPRGLMAVRVQNAGMLRRRCHSNTSHDHEYRLVPLVACFVGSDLHSSPVTPERAAGYLREIIVAEPVATGPLLRNTSRVCAERADPSTR